MLLGPGGGGGARSPHAATAASTRSHRTTAVYRRHVAIESVTRACDYCGRALPEAQLDLAPNGWRCAPCKAQHDIRVLRGGDEQRDSLDAAGMRAKASRLGAACGLLALAAVAMLGLFLVAGGRIETGRRVVDDSPLGTTYEVTTRRNPIDRVALGIPFAIGLSIWSGVGWRRAKRTADDMEREG